MLNAQPSQVRRRGSILRFVAPRLTLKGPPPLSVEMSAPTSNDADIAWKEPIRHFCESYRGDANSPEYYSAVSSLGITFFALLCLFTGRHCNVLVKLCAAILAWCGIGSFGFHYTLSEAWSFLDTFPMTVSSVLGMYLSWIIVLHEYTKAKRGLRRRKAILGVQHSRIMSALAILAGGLLIWSLVINVVYGNVEYDTVFTGLGAILILSSLLIRSCVRWRIRKEAKEHARLDDSKQARTIGGEGGGYEGPAVEEEEGIFAAQKQRIKIKEEQRSITHLKKDKLTAAALMSTAVQNYNSGSTVHTSNSSSFSTTSSLPSAPSSTTSSPIKGSSSPSKEAILGKGEENLEDAVVLLDVTEESTDQSMDNSVTPQGRISSTSPGRYQSIPGSDEEGKEAEVEAAWLASVKASEGNYMRMFGGETQAISVSLLGLVLVCIAAALWETSERLCIKPDFQWLKYLRLHSLWHLAIGYGVYCLLQASAVLSGPGLYGRAALFDNRRFRWKAINTCFPRVVYGPIESQYSERYYEDGLPIESDEASRD